MDLSKIVQNAGAGEPKQTRPNDAKWCNNAIQFRVRGTEAWYFWEFEGYRPDSPKQWDFIEGKTEVALMAAVSRAKHGSAQFEFRLVAIVEVF